MAVFDAESILSALKHVKTKTASALRDLVSGEAEVGSSARARITALFDEGTFVELGAFVKRRATELDVNTPDELESVICGYGAVDSRLVFAFAQDFSRTKGAFSEAHAEKIVSLYKLAMQNGAPIVGIFDSAGAALGDGVKALAGYGRVMACAAKASGVIPQIALIGGICAGAAATVASLFDFIVMNSKTGSLYVNAPSLIGSGGTDDFASSTGLVALSSEGDTEMISAARLLISYLPSNNSEGTAVLSIGDNPSKPVSFDYSASTEAITLITAIADKGTYLELYKSYAPEISVGFISLGDTVTGVVANNKAVKNGALTSSAARKAARFVSFCDCYNIPVVTLVDSCGLDATIEAEKSPYPAELSKLASAYASAECPLVTVVAGEAYGSVFTLMGSKSLGADVVYALDSAKIGALSAKSAVALLLNDKIGKKAKDGSVYTRESLETEWNETKGSAVEAAFAGEVDDIIDAAELRARVAAAVNMLAAKDKHAGGRRHDNRPL